MMDRVLVVLLIVYTSDVSTDRFTDLTKNTRVDAGDSRSGLRLPRLAVYAYIKCASPSAGFALT